MKKYSLCFIIKLVDIFIDCFEIEFRTHNLCTILEEKYKKRLPVYFTRSRLHFSLFYHFFYEYYRTFYKSKKF